MIKNSAKKKPAKKARFVSCNGCFGIFVTGTCIQAPKNKFNLKIVCPSCYRQYCTGAGSPMPQNASFAMIMQHGAYLNPKSAGILSNANGALISNAIVRLIGNDSAGMVNAGGMNLISDKSGG